MNQRLLLDTHLLLWVLSAPGRLSTEVRRDISKSEVLVSAASIWEIAIRFAAGKLEHDPAIVLHEAAACGFDMLPVTGLHAARSADLKAANNKDPFDRLLVAQALCESLILLSNDDALARYAPTVRMI